MKKTHNLKYAEFKCQDYLTTMSPLDAEIVFRARLGCISCKGNMPGSHRANMICRLCGEVDETQEHILNCRLVRGDKGNLEIALVHDMAVADPDDIIELCSRVRTFNDLITKKS